jgi:hypothetical protein
VRTYCIAFLKEGITKINKDEYLKADSNIIIQMSASLLRNENYLLPETWHAFPFNQIA